jgi:hypothetical protein
MPNSKAINSSKFFGKDRYEYYLNELLTEQTVGGKKLSKQELKEGFSKRKNKISFEKFVDGLVGVKGVNSRTTGTVSSSSSSGAGIGRGRGSLVRSPTGSIQKYFEVASKSQKTGAIEESISAITTSVVSIADTLSQRKKIKEDSLNYERRKNEQDKRELSENKLEKRFEGLKKAAEKIIAPVKSILDKIIEFFTTVILGRIVYKIVEWLGDPNNASKVKSLIRFVKDWWPALLGSYILFGNSFSKFIRGTVGLLGRFIFQIGKVAIPRLLSIITKNPLASLIVGTSVAGTFARTGERERLNPELNKQRDSVEKVQNDSSSSWYQKLGGFFAKQELTTGQRSQSITAPVPGAMFNGGGFVNGFVSGEKGVDKVPAMLSDGEFVMSRGAVEKYGVDTLEAMNAAGGGTNRPKVMSGTTYAAGGGYVGGDKLNESPSYYIGEIIKGLSPQFRWANDLARQVGVSAQKTISKSANSFSNIVSNSASNAYSGFMNKGAEMHGYLTRGGMQNDLMNYGNQAISSLQNNFNTLKDTAKSAYSSIDKLGTSKRYQQMSKQNEKKSQESISKYDAWVQSLPKGFLRDTMNRGLIPIPTGNELGMSGLTYIKAMLGPLGRPFRILSNEKVDKARQEMIDRTAASNGLRVGPNGKMSMEWNRVSGKGSGQYTDELDALGGSGGRGKFFNSTFGRWSGRQQGDRIVTDDVYNFNQSVGYYAGKSRDALMRGDVGDGLYNIASMAGKFAQDIGWMNQRALGSEIDVGSVKNIDAKTGKPKPPSKSSVTMYGKNDPRRKKTGPYKSRFSRPKNSGVKPVKPPVSQKPKVVYGPPIPASGNKYRGGQRSATRTPNFNASTSGSKSKQNTLGITR